MTEATVLIPTHDHGPMLAVAVRSVLRQTVRDVEVLIIGDGATEETRRTAEAMAATDRRVTFLDRPKGQRLGEIHRREAIADSTGAVILYQCDDDLWFPEHVAHMIELLDGADVAHALSCWIRSEGVIQHTTIDLSLPADRLAVLEGRKNPGLSVMGHTRAHYDRLPRGWHTTPEGTPTDLHMWRQLLAPDDVVARSGMLPTMVHLPSPSRRHLSLEERNAELLRYERLAEEPNWRRWFAERLLDGALREDAFFWARADALKAWGDRLEAWAAAKEAELIEVWESRQACQARVAELEATLASVRSPRRWRRSPT